jgi:hypothetical protein
MIAPRILIAIVCLTALAGCSACLPGQSRLDQGMVAKTNSAQIVEGSESVTGR